MKKLLTITLAGALMISGKTSYGVKVEGQPNYIEPQANNETISQKQMNQLRQIITPYLNKIHEGFDLHNAHTNAQTPEDQRTNSLLRVIMRVPRNTAFAIINSTEIDRRMEHITSIFKPKTITQRLISFASQTTRFIAATVRMDRWLMLLIICMIAPDGTAITEMLGYLNFTLPA